MDRHIRSLVVFVVLVVMFGVVGYTIAEAATTSLASGVSCNTFTDFQGVSNTGEPSPYRYKATTMHIATCNKTVERLQVNAVAYSPAWGGETGTYSGNVCYNTSQCTKTIQTYFMPGEFIARTGGRAGTESDPGRDGHFPESVKCWVNNLYNSGGVDSC